MRAVTSLLTLMLMAVLLWTIPVAHVSEWLTCTEVAAGSAGHFEGDADEVPGDHGKATPHHHALCHGHCIAIPADAATVETRFAEGSTAKSWRSLRASDADPEQALRPPIA